MRTAWFKITLISGALVAAVACGGGGEQPAPTTNPEPAAPTYPEMACPEGATFREAQTPQGFEQICEEAGVKNGDFRRWYSPELRAVSGKYYYGQTDDDWVWWYENGNKKSKGSYKRGKQSGSWTWWYESGEKAEEGDFLAGRKAGTWTRYFESGHKRDEGMFHNGVKNGKWEYFRDDAENTIKRTETWKTGGLASTEFFDLTGKKIDEPLPEDVDKEEPDAPPGAATEKAPAEEAPADEGEGSGG